MGWAYCTNSVSLSTKRKLTITSYIIRIVSIDIFVILTRDTTLHPYFLLMITKPYTSMGWANCTKSVSLSTKKNNNNQIHNKDSINRHIRHTHARHHTTIRV